MRPTHPSGAAKQPSPFDWRLPAARDDGASTRPQRRTAKAAARPMSAKERAERILAHRWGNPYCKPGMP